MTALEIRDLVIKADGFPIVNGLTLSVDEGERVGIVGDYQDAVLVMDVLCGLMLPDSGEIWIYNLPPRQALQRNIVSYTHQLVPTNSPPTSVLFTANPAFPQFLTNVIIHPIIEIFNKLIYNNYKFINLKKEGKLL